VSGIYSFDKIVCVVDRGVFFVTPGRKYFIAMRIAEKIITGTR
jgi:hypothetical protein